MGKSGKKKKKGASFEKDNGLDKVKLVQRATDEVADVARANIDKTLARGEKLGKLEEKAEDLTHHANRFKRQAVETKRALCVKNARNLCVLVTLVGSVLALLIWLIAEEV